MAFTINGSLAIDETSDVQGGSSTSNITADTDVAVTTFVNSSGAPEFSAFLSAFFTAPTSVSVSNASSINPFGTALLTGLGDDVTALAFTDATGAALDGDVAKFGAGATDFLRTADGAKIFLYSYAADDPSTTYIDETNIVLGREGTWNGTDYVADPSGDLVFAAYLQPTDASGNVLSSDADAVGAKVWLVEYEPIQHGTAGSTAAAYDDTRVLFDPLYVTVSNRTDFSLEGAPSGQNLFLMYGDGTPAAGEAAIVVTGKNPINQSSDPSGITSGDTVNTGQGGGGTTIGSNNQMIDPNEGMYFSFVTLAADSPPLTVPNLDQNEADVEANIKFASYLGVNEAIFTVVQLQPPKAGTLLITALNNTDTAEKGTLFIDGLNDGTGNDSNGSDDDVQVNVTEVTITRTVKQGNTTTTTTYNFSESGTTSDGGLTLDFTGNTVKITGVVAGDEIDYKTATEHNRVLIDNVGNADAKLNAAFDIGGFSLINSSVTPNLFSALAFQDDGPSVTVSATNESAVLLTTQDAQTDGDPTAFDTDATTADFSGVFGNLPVYGADGAGTTVKSYTVSLYGTDGGDSGLDSNGVQINLYNVSGVIVGSTAATAGTISAANTIFSIGVGAATGIVTLTQYAEIDHPIADDPTPTATPFEDQLAVLGTGLVKLTGSALTTDGDGDTATDSEDVDLGGNVRFADDGPSLSGVDDSNDPDVDSLVFANGTTDSDSYSFVPGADGPASPGVALTDFTNPDDAGDLAASGLGALETLLGVNITASQSGNTVTYYTPDGPDAGTDPDPLFSLVVTDSNWTFTILQEAPLVFNTFDFSTLAAGGPQETLSLEAGVGGTFGVFNGFLFGPIDAADGTEARGIYPPAPIDLPGTTGTNTDDDLNPDALGFGVRGGAASNMNNNEGFSLTFHDGSVGGALKTVEGMQFKMDQQGNTNDVVLSFELINGDGIPDSGDDPDIVAIEKGAGINLIDSAAGSPAAFNFSTADDGGFWLRMGLPGGNNDVFFTILGSAFEDVYTPAANELVVYVNGDYETAMFRMAYPDTGTYDQYPGQVNDSVRIKDVTLIERLAVPDIALDFTVQGTDGDGDTTQTESFNVFISQDGLPFDYPFV